RARGAGAGGSRPGPALRRRPAVAQAGGCAGGARRRRLCRSPRRRAGAVRRTRRSLARPAPRAGRGVAADGARGARGPRTSVHAQAPGGRALRRRAGRRERLPAAARRGWIPGRSAARSTAALAGLYLLVRGVTSFAVSIVAVPDADSQLRLLQSSVF